MALKIGAGLIHLGYFRRVQLGVNLQGLEPSGMTERGLEAKWWSNECLAS